MSGVDCPSSHLETVCRATLSSSANCSWDNPFDFLKVASISPNTTISPPEFLYVYYINNVQFCPPTCSGRCATTIGIFAIIYCASHTKHKKTTKIVFSNPNLLLGNGNVLAVALFPFWNRQQSRRSFWYFLFLEFWCILSNQNSFRPFVFPNWR